MELLVKRSGPRRTRNGHCFENRCRATPFWLRKKTRVERNKREGVVNSESCEDWKRVAARILPIRSLYNSGPYFRWNPPTATLVGEDWNIGDKLT